MSWMYSGTMVEDERRYTAPPEITGDDEEEDLPPYDRGYEDRFGCRERISPRYWHEESKTDWLRGWDAADAECREGEL